MGKCRFCNWVRARVCVDCTDIKRALGKRSRDWELDESNTWALYQANSKPYQDRVDQVDDLLSSNPEAGVGKCHELAELGSTWAMETLGWCYEGGTGCDADLEQSAAWYRRAAEAGSRIATLDYARVLKKQGHRETARQMLQNGVDAGFLPANYWLAILLQSDGPNRTTARELADLLEAPTAAGHPLAHQMLVRLLVRGKLGPRARLRGWRMLLAEAFRIVRTNARDYRINADDSVAPTV